MPEKEKPPAMPVDIYCAEKMQDFQNQHRDWRAVLLQVRTNGLAK